MKRYAAFLRGVMPTNCRMADLKQAFEAAGFADVKTVLGSGNVLFSAPSARVAAIERKAEAAMEKHLGRTFFTIVRPVDELRKLVATDPYAKFKVKPGAKRVVTFFRGQPKRLPKLPIEQDGARILAVRGGEAFITYERTPKGPVFMVLIEKTFGRDVTTRTWETVNKMTR